MAEGEKDTAKKILDAAFTCITARGYANVSMRDIAEEAGVVLSQINYYYKNKEGLFCAVIRFVKQEYLQIIETNLQDIVTTKDKVSFLVQYCQDLMRDNRDLYKLLLEFFSMAMWSKAFEQEMNLFFREISEVIGRYIVSDYSINESLQAHSPTAIARMVLGGIFGIAMQYILEPDDQEILDGLNIIQAVIK
jgi:AcrR family transcriptional regulator